MLFFYLQVERDGDQHPAGGHDAVAGPEQWPPACVLDEQTLVDVVEEESNIQTRLIRCIRISVCCFPLHCLSSMSGIRNVYVANDFFLFFCIFCKKIAFVKSCNSKNSLELIHLLPTLQLIVCLQLTQRHPVS